MIPPTRQPKPYKRPDGLPFAPGDAWRPLRLVLDDDSLPDPDVALLLSFADAEELELTRTAPGALPRLEPQEPQEDFVPIHRVGPSGGTELFWVRHAAKLAERARRVTEETDIDERSAWRALVLSEASEEMEADGFVTARDLLLEQRSDPYGMHDDIDLAGHPLHGESRLEEGGGDVLGAKVSDGLLPRPPGELALQVTDAG